MMKIKKIIGAVLSSVVMISVMLSYGTVAFASKDKLPAVETENFKYCGVYDDYGLYDSSELAELNALVQETAENINMYVAIYLSGTDLSDPATETFADEFSEDLFGENTDNVVYYMDLSGGIPAYDYISTSGMAALVYTDERNDGSDNRIDKMLESIFNYLPSSGEEIDKYDITNGIQEICRQLEMYAEKGAKSGYYCYDSNDGKYIYQKNGTVLVTSKKPITIMFKFIVPGIIAGIIISIVLFFIIKSNYRFKTSCDSSVYVAKNATKFTVKCDRFIREYTTKTKIESKSSGGGGSHGGGGGGSHGGGGGHR